MIGKQSRAGSSRGFRSKIAILLSLMLLLQTGLAGGWWVGTQVAEAAATKYITFLYDDFGQAASRLQFNGQAQIANGALRLTPSTKATFGSVFNKERVSLSDQKSFSTYFEFQMSDPDSIDNYPPGADGFVFTLQTNSNDAGSIGNGIGYGGIGNSIGIEFDTFANQDAGIEDPDDHHVAIQFNGSVKHQGQTAGVDYATSYNFKQGGPYYAWIDYDGAAQTVKVYVNNSAARPSSPLLVKSGINLSGILGSNDVYAGFTSATGSAFENHDIKQWYFTNRHDPIDLSCGCYAEAPAKLSYTTVVNSVYGYYTDIALSSLSGQPGANVALEISQESHVVFVDANDNSQDLADAPGVTTDANGLARVYFRGEGGDPSFRVSTEYGVYKDIIFTLPPTVTTGAITPAYPGMTASIGLNVVGTGGETITDWGVQYREKTTPEANWIPVKGDPPILTTTGPHAVTLAGLSENTDYDPHVYEARAYAVNAQGASYGEVKEFAVEEPMSPGDVVYDRTGPSHIYMDDEITQQIVGHGFNKLKKRMNGLSVSLFDGTDTTAIGAEQIHYISDTLLSIDMPEGLPLGAYDLILTHSFFNDRSFEDALTVTDDPIYRTRNYEEITAENEFADADQVSKIVLRGPFKEYASEPGIFKLSDPNEVVSLNGNLLFKGSSLEVDKTGPRDIIRGNGRLYVNGKGTIDVLTAYTLHDGEFELKPEDFELVLEDNLLSVDYIGMSTPINVHSISFLEDGIRVKGSIEVGFNMGKTSVGGSAIVNGLDFKGSRVDLDADFTIGADFKTGPIDSSELRVGINTAIQRYSFGATAGLRKYNLGFEMDLAIKQSQLDAVSFAIHANMPIPGTGVQVTRLGAGIENLAGQRTAPLTFRALGGLSDIVTPIVDGDRMVNINPLDAEISANHFGANGTLALYSVDVANLDLFVVANPTGYKGYTKAGFKLTANVSLLDVLVGEIMAKYFSSLGIEGYAKGKLQIPRNIPLVGGQKLASAEMGVDSERAKGGFSVIGIGFRVAYIFSKDDVDFDVDMFSTVKNVAKKAVNTVVNVAKSLWPFSRAPHDPIAASLYASGLHSGVSGIRGSVQPYSNESNNEDTDADSIEVSQIIGEKMQNLSGRPAEGSGRYMEGYATTMNVALNPQVTAAGGDTTIIRHSFEVKEAYRAVLDLSGAGALPSIVLKKPDGSRYPLRFEASDEGEANAVYSAEAGKVLAEVEFNEKGIWTLEAPDTVSMTAGKLLFRKADVAFEELADQWLATDEAQLVPMKLDKPDLLLLELTDASPDTAIYQPDGRPYVLEANENEPAWNRYYDSQSGKLYLYVDAAETGTWLLAGGDEALLNTYRIQPGKTMREALNWLQSDQHESVLQLDSSFSGGVVLEIEHASADAAVFRPDGTEYPLQSNPNLPGWNASYDAEREAMTVLLDVDHYGLWMVRSGQFPSVYAFALKSSPSDLGDLFESSRSMGLDMQEQGRYVFAISGENDGIAIQKPDGSAYEIVSDENASDRNAIWNEDQQTLYVTVDVDKLGVWSVRSNSWFGLDLYTAPPAQTIEAFHSEAVEGAEGNTFRLSWNVSHPKPDTHVTMMIVPNAEERVGEIVADGLPAAGITEITLPEGYMPGEYWLVMKADGDSSGPMFRLSDSAINVTAKTMLPRPEQLEVVSTGNGEITLRFTDTHAEDVSYFRILTADEEGNLQYEGPTLDVEPQEGAEQEAIVYGLETGQTHRLAVMAIKENEEGALYSQPSEIVTAELPVPNRAALDVVIDSGGAAQVEHEYTPYYADDSSDEQLRLTVTSSHELTLTVQADQAVSAELFVGGESQGVKEADPEMGAEFSLTDLTERDYTIEIEAENEAGDISRYYQKLFVDETAPFLYVEEPVSGYVEDGNRVLFSGAAEPGVRLTANDRLIPVNEYGQFHAYLPITEDEGVLPIELLAKDEVGNTTTYRLEVLKGNGGASGQESPADLSALTTDMGDMSTLFDPGVTDYSLLLDAATKHIRVWATAVNGDSSVKINGKSPDEDGSVMIDIPEEGTTVEVNVTAANLSTKQYELHVARDTDQIAILNNLQLGSGELNASFNGMRTSYTMNVGNEVDSLTATAEAFASGSTILVNGMPVADGQASAPIALPTGDSLVSIEVKSPNGEASRMYEVTVTREKSGNADLSELSLGDAEWNQTFASDIKQYAATVTEGTSTLSVAATTADEAAVMTLNGETFVSERQVQLQDGANQLEIEVTAENGNTNTYIVNVYRETVPEFTANLKSLTVKQTELSTAFSPWVMNYALEDESYTGSMMTIEAFSEDEQANVTVNGETLQGGGTFQVPIRQTGNNYVGIKVESPDQFQTRNYAIKVVHPQTSSPIVNGVNVNGQGNIATGSQKNEYGRQVMHVSFDAVQLDKMIETVNSGDRITVSIPSSAEAMNGMLTGDMVKKLEGKQLSLDIVMGRATYTISAEAMEIDSVQEHFGAAVPLEDIEVSIRIVPPTVEQKQVYEGTMAEAGIELLAEPVDFTIVYSHNGQAYTPDRMPSYVERSVLVDDEEQAKRITTGVRVNPDGSFEHVPTIVYEQDGQYWARMNSLTNSLYAAIYHQQSFADTKGHWAQAAVEDMASRLIVNGKSADRFEPDSSITRAEFTAMIMRALGLPGQSGQSSYSDVSASDWFGPLVLAASDYELISGYDDKTFRPNQRITRAEAMVIMNRAARLADMEAVMSDQDARTLLSAAPDNDDIPGWAYAAVAMSLKSGIANGYEDGSIKPNRSVTRAETAQLIRNLLVKAELIE
ncbi:cadherin-like beta sandwich domain-containing protein [Paenibacillus sp. HB172176]|uniref:cadherin-like beta sandwich domain-containing protein n=1 Tax=Paenibacillus sp. HB172176 TaxID=2493690 RepID=UPI00143C2BC1|nr:cadherin-like beta sandwich domain-containing protein [Paenibacillus sp. HB172176]